MSNYHYTSHVSDACSHCGEGAYLHVNGQCLWGPTRWVTLRCLYCNDPAYDAVAKQANPTVSVLDTDGTRLMCHTVCAREDVSKLLQKDVVAEPGCILGARIYWLILKGKREALRHGA